MTAINRRDFTRQLLATVASSTLLPPHFRLEAKDPWRQSGGPRKRVVVLGAGLAGLSAAYELDVAGHEVVVLEARQRAGGRVLTVRDRFPDGLHAELGATRISERHDWVQKYVSTFHLALDPLRPNGGRDVVHVRGQRLVLDDEARMDWPLQLSEEERRLGLPGMRERYLTAALAEVGLAGAPEAPPMTLARYDSVSYADFFRRQGASPDAILLLTLGATTREIESTSALQRLRALAWRNPTRQWTRIRGGNDQLPGAFARALARRIHYGTAVTHIEQTSRSVRVSVERTGQRDTIDGDYVVCTIPFPVLRTLPMTQAFPTRVQAVIRDYGYGSTTKVVLQTRSRFWESEGLSGFGTTDRPGQQVWNITGGQPGPRGLLVVYTTGSVVSEKAGPLEADRISWAAKEAEFLFPGLAAELEGGMAYSWDEDPWSRSAFPQPLPGQLIEFLTIVRKPTGRVYFAGDHASAWPGWMQGAMEAGNHAARMIDAAT